MKKYHIILDTTNLFTSEFKVIELNKPVLDFKKFIDKYGNKDLNLYVPQVVLDERIKQNVIRFETHRDKIIECYNKIKESGLNLDISVFDKFKYQSIIKRKINSSLKHLQYLVQR